MGNRGARFFGLVCKSFTGLRSLTMGASALPRALECAIWRSSWFDMGAKVPKKQFLGNLRAGLG
jgi:hypothetical protein